MLKKSQQQLKTQNSSLSGGNISSPIERLREPVQKNILKKLSQHVLNLYQKKTDIKKFTELALSNPEDTSHNDLVKEKNLDEYDLLFDLPDNEDFLKDLGL